MAKKVLDLSCRHIISKKQQYLNNKKETVSARSTESRKKSKIRISTNYGMARSYANNKLKSMQIPK